MPIRATYEVECNNCGGLLDDRFDSRGDAMAAARAAGWADPGDHDSNIRCGNCRTA